MTQYTDEREDDERMSPAEFRVAREFLGLTPEWTAKFLGVSARTVRHWEAGKYLIPDGVRRQIRRLETQTGAYVDTVVRHLKDAQQPAVTTYSRDEEYRLADPNSPYPASWHRAVTGRVALQVPGLRVHYPQWRRAFGVNLGARSAAVMVARDDVEQAGQADIPPVPVSAGHPVTETQRTQLADVLNGVFIDDAALADPRGFLLAEIGDYLDDDTDAPAYPELLDAARLWSDAQCAALLREHAPAAGGSAR